MLTFIDVWLILWFKAPWHPKLDPMWLQIAQMSSWLVSMGVPLAAPPRFSSVDVESDLNERAIPGARATPDDYGSGQRLIDAIPTAGQA